MSKDPLQDCFVQLVNLTTRDKDKRMTNKELEMIWQTSDDAPNEIFTGINYNVYWPPDYFCWDFYCNDEPIMDNPILKDYNVEKRIDDFFDYILEQHSYYATDHILVTLGMDFHYQVRPIRAHNSRLFHHQ